MKTFKTAKGALRFIKRNLNTGIELTVNDSVHFGIGETVYAYSKDVQRAGYVPNDSTFTHLTSDEMIICVLQEIKYIHNGYIIL